MWHEVYTIVFLQSSRKRIVFKYNTISIDESSDYIVSSRNSIFITGSSASEIEWDDVEFSFP